MKKTLVRPYTPCPCDSGQTYVQCCGPWHQGLGLGVFAPTPEALMRSRYSAYVLGLVDYLLAIAQEHQRRPQRDAEAAAQRPAAAVLDPEVANTALTGHGLLHHRQRRPAVAAPVGAEVKHGRAAQGIDVRAAGLGRVVGLCHGNPPGSMRRIAPRSQDVDQSASGSTICPSM